VGSPGVTPGLEDRPVTRLCTNRPAREFSCSQTKSEPGATATSRRVGANARQPGIPTSGKLIVRLVAIAPVLILCRYSIQKPHRRLFVQGSAPSVYIKFSHSSDRCNTPPIDSLLKTTAYWRNLCTLSVSPLE